VKSEPKQKMPTNDHYGYELEGQGLEVRSEWCPDSGVFLLHAYRGPRWIESSCAKTIVAARRKLAAELRRTKRAIKAATIRKDGRP